MGKKKRAKIAPLNRLPLLPSGPGGVQQELVVLTRRVQRYTRFARVVPVGLLFLHLQHLSTDNQALLFRLPIALACNSLLSHMKKPRYSTTTAAK
jgi:hypothetical protein